MIPLWAISAIGAGAVAGAAGFGGGYWIADLQGDERLATKERGWAQERTSAAEATTRASETARATEAAWAASAAMIQTEGEQRHAQITADADRARRAAGSLRDALDIATRALRRGTAEAPATAAECAATDSAARVFAELFGRADEAAGVLAEYGDAARIAGDACVAADQVTR